MTSNKIRGQFIDFFKGKGHQFVPSSPVVPQDDPTLFFANAGMNQFKDIFLGLKTPEHPRVANTQKCIRVSGKHNDLEEVGKDGYHHTFFEMLGNWSFGDYFKREAIAWAWELLTGVWKLPKDRLYGTVYLDDEEAEILWKEVTDIDPSHVMRFDEKDNFWEMGETGPCGPCSEIHIDRGEEYCDKKDVPGHVCGINQGCARYIELWNLVFIQFNRDESGKLHDLPAKHVDTGAGLERIVSVIEGKRTDYETDLFWPIIEGIVRITGKGYFEDQRGTAHRVIADHIRALTFAITDGAIPSNEGRGYVLRRILRRAARFGRNLGMREPFVYQLVPHLTRILGDAFPEIKEREDFVSRIIRAEEGGFGKTLDRGLEIFEEIVEALDKSDGKKIPGKDAFKLYDTYGFPLDLTQLMAEERGLTVDTTEFDMEMTNQQERSRKTDMLHRADRDLPIFDVPKSKFDYRLTEQKFEHFIHYDIYENNLGLILYNESTNSGVTPFYPESGGQVGDTGILRCGPITLEVKDTRKSYDYIYVVVENDPNRVKKFAKALRDKNPIIGSINIQRRGSTARNHTATHLLHRALKETLGEHVNQSGSLVHPDYLRFDFTHFEKLTDEELERVEGRVNEKIRENLPVKWYETPFDEAKKKGVVALFGEKYGERVRVVETVGYTAELCGGTHVRATGEIGYLKIVGETAAAAGIRRIEARTGEKAAELIIEESRRLVRIQDALQSHGSDELKKLQKTLEEKHQLEKELERLKRLTAENLVDDLIQKAVKIEDFRVVTAQVESSSMDDLKHMADLVREKIKSGVGLLGAVIGDKAALVCTVTDDLIKKQGLKAGDVVGRAAKLVGGGGGGRPHLATAGGKDVSQLDHALKEGINIIRNSLAIGQVSQVPN